MAYCFGNPGMIRKPRATDWTEQNVEQLRTLAREGKTQQEIAQVLGRSESATKRKGQKLGVWRKQDTFWSDSEVTQLRQLAKTHTLKEAAVALSRTFGSVAMKTKYLGVSFLKCGEASSLSTYTEEDIRRVFELRRQGATLREISLATGIHFTYVGDILNYERRYRDSFKQDASSANVRIGT